MSSVKNYVNFLPMVRVVAIAAAVYVSSFWELLLDGGHSRILNMLKGLRAQ